MKKTEKTVRALYNEFLDKFTTDQVTENIELSMLFKYLQHQCSMANGNYIHIPGPSIRSLIEKHLEYTFLGTPNPEPSCQNA